MSQMASKLANSVRQVKDLKINQEETDKGGGKNQASNKKVSSKETSNTKQSVNTKKNAKSAQSQSKENIIEKEEAPIRKLPTNRVWPD